jgi:hypothetical protein
MKSRKVVSLTISWVSVWALGLATWIAVSVCAQAQNAPSAEARLKELKIVLPPVANYVDAVRATEAWTREANRLGKALSPRGRKCEVMS